MKIIEVVAHHGYLDSIKGIATQNQARDVWVGPEGEDGRQAVRILTAPENRQAILDALQGMLQESEKARIYVIAPEVVLPRHEKAEENGEETKKAVIATREEIYNNVEKNARLTTTFLLLVFLSTVVVAIGLLEDNVAVVIGAMVIAPLLGPNIALALAAALGDNVLMWKSLRTTFAGMALALGFSFVVGLVWPLNVESRELLVRTDVGLDSVVLALASGATAALSLTTGLSSVLVGVMVAVALLPPTATLGLMLGAGQSAMATGAGLLLAVNVVSVNLAAKIVFLIQGVKPRGWLEKQKARQSMATYISLWVVSLLILLVAIYLRQEIRQAQ